MADPATKARKTLTETGYYRDLGKKGGEATRARHGSEHYRELGAKGGARLRELIAKGRAAEKAAQRGEEK